jgi:hypothetical protein
VTTHPLRSSVAELMAEARRVATVDIVDDEVVEPLTVLHGALCDEQAQLNAEGSRGFEKRLLRSLVNRLRMARDLQRHPEIAEQPILGPVVVTGAARSGTTKLQKALAASGCFNYLPLWQALNWASVSGLPGEPIEVRMAEADAFCTWIDERSPGVRLGHRFATHEPEEDGFLSEGCFVSSSPLGYVEIPAYGRWLAGQPRSTRFEFQRAAMQYLQWQGLARPDRPWVIKCPSYLSQELDLLRVFPEARFVVAHRSPIDTIPSMCRLLECFHEAYGRSRPVTRHALSNAAWVLDTHLANRAAHPDLPVLDLRFEDVVHELPTALARIFDHAGITLTDAARANASRWDGEHTMHELGRFEYSLEEYGLDEGKIRTTLRTYLEFLDSIAA